MASLCCPVWIRKLFHVSLFHQRSDFLEEQLCLSGHLSWIPAVQHGVLASTAFCYCATRRLIGLVEANSSGEIISYVVQVYSVWRLDLSWHKQCTLVRCEKNCSGVRLCAHKVFDVQGAQAVFYTRWLEDFTVFVVLIAHCLFVPNNDRFPFPGKKPCAFLASKMWIYYGLCWK